MMKKQFSPLPLWQFEILSNHRDLVHYVSGRAGGASEGEKGGLNLSFNVGDDPSFVSENRQRLANSIGVDLNKLIFPQQTHSLHVKCVSQHTAGHDLADTDAIITDCRGICISVMSADCVPILIYDPQKKVIAAVHSGWRGTVGKILSLTIKTMCEQYGSQPAHLIAGIGPSICSQNYEVGDEVIFSVKKAFTGGEGLLSEENGSGKAFFNLWEANRRQLLELGVPEKSIELSGLCTYERNLDFFSARRSKLAGRFAAGIMMKN
jgi:YfiH family protein